VIDQLSKRFERRAFVGAKRHVATTVLRNHGRTIRIDLFAVGL